MGCTVWGSNSGRGRDFPHSPRLVRPTQSPVRWVSGHSRRQSGRGVALTNHPHVVPTLKKEYIYTFTPPLGLTGLLSVERCLKKSRNMLYSVTHTATPLHGLRSGTSPNVLLNSLLNFQFKTPTPQTIRIRHEYQLRLHFRSMYFSPVLPTQGNELPTR